MVKKITVSFGLFAFLFCFNVIHVYAQNNQVAIEPAAHIGGDTKCSIVRGDHAFVGQGGYLTILDISGQEYEQVAYLDLPGMSGDVAISGSYLFFTTNGLSVVDISDPLNPSLVHHLEIAIDDDAQVFISGNYAYIAASNNGLLVIDISTPASPSHVSTFTNGNSLVDVYVSGNYAYVLDQTTNQLRVVDVSDPTNPIEGSSIEILNPIAITGRGDHLYIAGNSYPDIGMHIVSISDPANPIKTSFFETAEVDGLNKRFFGPQKITVDSDYAYIGSQFEAVFIVANISDPANPFEIGKKQLGALREKIVSIQIEYPTAYIAIGFSDRGFRKIDLSDLSNPSEINQFESPWDVLWTQATTDYLYVASLNRLWIYDMADPSKPKLVASHPELGDLFRIVLVDNILHALDAENLRLIDISNPNQLIEKGAYSLGGRLALEVTVFGNYAYILFEGNPGTLEIVDISDSANPMYAGIANLPGIGRDISVMEGSAIAYVAYFADDTDKGFQIVDVTDPSLPVVLGSAQTVGTPMSISVSGDTLYIASNTGIEPNISWHLEAFDISDPANPIKITELGDYGEIWDIEIQNGRILAGITGGSVYVIGWGIDLYTGNLVILAICTSDLTRQISAITPMGNEGNGYVADTGGYGEPLSYGKKYIRGDYGINIQVFEIPPYSPPLCCIGTAVVPVEAIVDGCLASPSCSTGECGTGVGVQALLTGNCDKGWVFTKWSGAVNALTLSAAGKFAKETPPGCTAYGGCPQWLANANFAPWLKVSGASAPVLCPVTEDEEELLLVPIQLEASTVDNWDVTKITVQIEGDDEIKKSIKEARLEWKGGKQTKSYSQGASSIEFTTSGLIVQKSQSESISLYFIFKKMEGVECSSLPKELNVTISNSDVEAEPQQAKYKPGVILDGAGGKTVLACIWNTDNNQNYEKIQDAVDAASPGNTILVCPGTYEENVDMNKSVILKSIKGYAVTIVQGKSAEDHVFHVKHDNTEINGFTIQNATSQDKAGIYVFGSIVNNTKIMQNKITGNHFGVFLNYAQKAQIKGNLIWQNKNNGIHAISSTGHEILNNSIWKNDHGIKLETHLFYKTKIAYNDIANNIHDGIHLQVCKDIRIEENVNIRENRSSGIFIAKSDSIHIINNSGIDKNRLGINSFLSKNLVIQGNSILDNSSHGIELFKTSSSLIGGNHNQGQGNFISGNANGVVISWQESIKNKIKGNIIGTNKEGTAKYSKTQDVGVGVQAASENEIGGNVDGEGNIISANDKGILISGSKNIISGNYVGTNSLGSSIIGNYEGIVIAGSSNIVGSKDSDSGRNFISNNTQAGISIRGGNSKNNKVWGNYIGTDPTGTKRRENGKGIELHEGTENTIIGIDNGEGKGNVISGNEIGIDIGGKNNKVRGNMIGLAKNGLDSLKNSIGIKIDEDFNIIGGKTNEERNIISGNSTGIQIFDGSNNTIEGNFIGTDKMGKNPKGNYVGIDVVFTSHLNTIGGRTPNAKNVISANTTGIQISSNVYQSSNNKIWGNYIGTDESGNNPLKNYNGIVLKHGAVSNHIGGKKKYMGNIISGNNEAGIVINGDYRGNAAKNIIKGNTIGPGKYLTVDLKNRFGVKLGYNSKDNIIESNTIWYNDTSIFGKKDKNKINANSIKEGSSVSTGIRLDQSHSQIIGNIITRDAGDAIRCENGSNPLIRKNMIFDNNGFGLNNMDPSVTIQAQDNWWGDASGPGGAGPGSGEEINGNVDFSNWLPAPVSLLAMVSIDTLFISNDQIDSVICSFQNWQNLNDILDVSTTDALGWITGPTNYSIALQDSLGADSTLYIVVPEGALVGTKNKVEVKAVSQSNAAIADSVSFVVIVHNPLLKSIFIEPNTAVVRLGTKHQFAAQAYDSLGNTITINMQWSSTGGTIDDTGLFTADSDTGNFMISAEDITSHIKGTATVKILPELSRVVVSPDSVVLKKGETQQFTTQGYDPTNAAVKVYPLWETTAGEIDSSGFYTAGVDTGVFWVIAQDRYVPVSDSARVKVVSITDVSDPVIHGIPSDFHVYQNYPNPLNPSTTIRFDVARPTHVEIKLYDVHGRLIGILVDEERSPGNYKVVVDASMLASGLYFYEARLGSYQSVRKMLVLK